MKTRTIQTDLDKILTDVSSSSATISSTAISTFATEIQRVNKKAIEHPETFFGHVIAKRLTTTSSSN